MDDVFVCTVFLTRTGRFTRLQSIGCGQARSYPLSAPLISLASSVCFHSGCYRPAHRLICDRKPANSSLLSFGATPVVRWSRWTETECTIDGRIGCELASSPCRANQLHQKQWVSAAEMRELTNSSPYCFFKLARDWVLFSFLRGQTVCVSATNSWAILYTSTFLPMPLCAPDVSIYVYCTCVGLFQP